VVSKYWSFYISGCLGLYAYSNGLGEIFYLAAMIQFAGLVLMFTEGKNG